MIFDIGVTFFGYNPYCCSPCNKDVSAFIPKFAHRFFESVSPLRHGLDVLIVRGILTKNFSQNRDVAGEPAFFDEGIGPNLLHQHIFFDDVAAVLNQDNQRLQRLWRERHGHTVSEQDALFASRWKGPNS